MRSAARSCDAGRLPSPAAGAQHAIVTVLLAAAIACAVAAVCAGCSASAAPADIAGQDAGSGVSARLSLSPSPAPVMKGLKLSVALTDTRGQPVVGRAVTFDLSMPAMEMPPNHPQVTAAGGGVYEATTLLSMGGEWQLTVEVGGADNPVAIPLTFSAQ